MRIRRGGASACVRLATAASTLAAGAASSMPLARAAATIRYGGSAAGSPTVPMPRTERTSGAR